MSNSPSLPSHLSEPLISIERALTATLAGALLSENLREAIGYALLGGGKRLRPLLAWHSAMAAGAADGAVSLPAGVSVELIHAFSLVHDDLPAMDDDDLRRGRPTLHIHAGEAMAILAGDAMTVLAYQALESTPEAARLSRELSEGALGMIVGQVYDTLGGAPATERPDERVAMIHRHKTGALIRASCRMGAILGGASDDGLAAITTYAEAAGLMFQIVDDILDVTQPEERLGKRSGKDEAAGKATFPGILGLEASRRAVGREHARAVAAVRPLGGPARALVELADFLAVRTR